MTPLLPDAREFPNDVNPDVAAELLQDPRTPSTWLQPVLTIVRHNIRKQSIVHSTATQAEPENRNARLYAHPEKNQVIKFCGSARLKNASVRYLCKIYQVNSGLDCNRADP